MDGILLLDLVDGCLSGHLLEGVRAAAQPVRPRCEYLASTPVAPLFGTEPVDDIPVTHRERPQGGPHFGDDRPLVTVADDPLVASGRRGLRWALLGGRDRYGHELWPGFLGVLEHAGGSPSPHTRIQPDGPG